MDEGNTPTCEVCRNSKAETFRIVISFENDISEVHACSDCVNKVNNRIGDRERDWR